MFRIRRKQTVLQSPHSAALFDDWVNEIINEAMELLKQKLNVAAYNLLYELIEERLRGWLESIEQSETDAAEAIELNLEWISKNVTLEMMELLICQDKDAHLFCGKMLTAVERRAQWYFDDAFRAENEALADDPVEGFLYKDIQSHDDRLIRI